MLPISIIKMKSASVLAILLFVAVAFAQDPDTDDSQDPESDDRLPRGLHGGYGGAIQTGIAASAGQSVGLGPDVAIEHGGPPHDIAFGKQHYLGPVSVKSKAGGYGKYVILKGVKHTVIPFVKTGLKYIPKKFYIYGQKHVAVPYYKKITSTVEHLGAGVGHASKVYTAYDEKLVPVIKDKRPPLKEWGVAPIKGGHGW